jgi:hypothetical protein
MSYGALGIPLIAADLVGLAFWRNIQKGFPAGESLRRVKIHLHEEMSRRQGYLDGEDQKTLISFTLYGDPLAQPGGFPYKAKAVRREAVSEEVVHTVCDRVDPVGEARPVPPEVNDVVRQVVSRYLPDMDGADLTFTYETDHCEGKGHICPTSELGVIKDGEAKSAAAENSYARPVRSLVTLSKQVRRSGSAHQQVARLTLDDRARLVKLVVSR